MRPTTEPRLLSGVLLAGGASRRMGRDKALVEIEGEALVYRGIRVLSAVCDDVVVASGDGHRLGRLAVPQVADPFPGTGPLAGILAGLQAARHDLVAVLAVDLPEASAEILRLLADRWAGEDAVVPQAGGRLQPLHAIWHRSAADLIRAQVEAGARAVHAALDALHVRIIDLPDDRFARNLNTPHGGVSSEPST